MVPPPTSSVEPSRSSTSVLGGASSPSLPSLASYASERRHAWSLVPLAPALVVLFGLAVVLAIELLGLGQLARASDAHVAARADVFASAEAMRLSQLTLAGREECLHMTARRTDAELLILDAHDQVAVDATHGGVDEAFVSRLRRAPRGEIETRVGRTFYSVRPIGAAPAEYSVAAFVPAPRAPEGGHALISALVALTTLLLGVAASVAYAVARDANLDVEILASRVRAMAQVRAEPSGETVPVRAMDEVGILTSAFNQLVGRFVEGERSYRANLDRAHKADRDRAAFLATVSHELRSPLNAILGFADLLMQEVDGPLSPDAREEVEQIRASGAHLLELINDILEFSALEGGQLKLARAKVDLSALASDVLREATPLLAGRPVTPRLEGETGVVIEADAKRIRQILTNLVGNAVKFTQRGEVVISVHRQGAYAKIAVRDTGPGISDAERAVIFEDYKQAGEERRRRRGTGLGLAIARRLVLAHGGVIQVESEVGHGSTFHVLLPISPRSVSMRPRA